MITAGKIAIRANLISSPSAPARPGSSLWGLSLGRDFSSSFWSGHRLCHKAIETSQSLIFLFQEFAVGNRLCNWRFWLWGWRYDAVIAIKPLLRSIFDLEATS
jgi:hypothetical protein